MITIISGTNRPNSFTLNLAEYYQHEFLKSGVKVNLLNLENLSPELITPESYTQKPEEFLSIQKLINETKKFVFIIPEYNGSFPGILKLLIDNCQFPSSFYDKKACLVGLSAGKYGNIRGVEHFSGVCAYLHLNLLPLRLHIPLIKNEFDTNQNLIAGDTQIFIQDQIKKFIDF